MLQMGVSLLPVISYHGEDSSALTVLLQYTVPKTLGLFFTKEVSKTPITPAPCEPSWKLGIPHEFASPADGKPPEMREKHNQDVFLQHTQTSPLAVPSDLHIPKPYANTQQMLSL